MKKPKAPKETAEERALRDRQVRDLDAKQERENRLRKMIAFGRLGTRQLLSGSAVGILDERMGLSRLGGTNPGRGGGAAPGGSGSRGGGGGGGSGGGGGGSRGSGAGDLRLR